MAKNNVVKQERGKQEEPSIFSGLGKLALLVIGAVKVKNMTLKAGSERDFDLDAKFDFAGNPYTAKITSDPTPVKNMGVARQA